MLLAKIRKLPRPVLLTFNIFKKPGSGDDRPTFQDHTTGEFYKGAVAAEAISRVLDPTVEPVLRQAAARKREEERARKHERMLAHADTLSRRPADAPPLYTVVLKTKDVQVAEWLQSLPATVRLHVRTQYLPPSTRCLTPVWESEDKTAFFADFDIEDVLKLMASQVTASIA